MSDSANKITADILLRVSAELPNVRLWRQNRITAIAVGKGGKLRRVDAGIDGQGDITGMARIEAVPWEHRELGLRLEIEVKAEGDTMRKSQLAFQKVCQDMAVIYIIATSAEQCLADLRARLAEY